MSGTTMVRRCVLAASIWLLAGPAIASEKRLFDEIPGVQLEYYEVEGRTARELYDSMLARGPGGDRGFAQTKWQMDVDWRERKRGSKCEVRDARAHLSITVILPKLRRVDGMTPEALDYWKSMLRWMEAHEEGHVRIAWEHRNDFSRSARKASCASIKQVARATQAKIVALQRNYDRRAAR